MIKPVYFASYVKSINTFERMHSGFKTIDKKCIVINLRLQDTLFAWTSDCW